jgi:hypothetical protein
MCRDGAPGDRKRLAVRVWVRIERLAVERLAGVAGCTIPCHRSLSPNRCGIDTGPGSLSRMPARAAGC